MLDTLLIAAAFGGLALLAILLAVCAAFRLGERRGMGQRSPRFKRLAAPINLDRTEWKVEVDLADGTGTSRKMLGWMRFRQSGTRLVGEGEDAFGRRWSAEGVVFHRQVTYLSLDRMRRGHSLGTVHVHVSGDGMSLEGLRTSMPPGSNTLSITPIHLHRVPAASAPTSTSAAKADAAKQHDAVPC